MKINILSSALAAILGFALIGAPVTAKAQATNDASTPSAPAAKTKKAKGDYTQYKGTISAIDASSVTVTTSKGDVKLAIDDKTKFAVDKKASTAADFAKGDEVTGSYKTAADGTLTAHTVHKKTAK